MKSAKLVLLFFILLGSVAWAKEGSDQYPFGAENWFAGVLPPTGNYYVNYFGFYGGRLKNGSGQNAVVAGATPKVDATFNAFRYVYVSPRKFLGATYAAHIIVPVVHQSVDMGGSASKSGAGDITIDPLIFGWHFQNWHMIAALDTLLPTGYYDKNDGRVTLGANYYGFDPLFSVTCLPKSGWESSVKLMYNMKTTNQATNYHSGQEFHTDYAFGKHAGPWLLGATGYAMVQTTNDTIGGQVVPAAAGLWDAGHKGQMVAVGPSVGYENKRHMIFAADWQHETMVNNRFGGDKFWFKMIIPVDGAFRRHY
jgi:hypothetical protein